MKWLKKGKIYSASGEYVFDNTHCHKPTPLLIDKDRIRIYFGVRDIKNKTRTTFIDVRRDNPSEIIYIHNKPVLGLGKIGAFDDSGANVSSVIARDGKIYMYYIGWNPSTTVHTRNAIGLAVSRDGGVTFERAYDGSILDRNKDEPYYTGAVDVKFHEGKWMMWYTSGTEWKMINDKPEIWYHIKYAHSENGIDWTRDNISCIPPQDEQEATARPSVVIQDNRYKMWFSKRSIVNFRHDSKAQYRAGYAVSKDGIEWVRDDSSAGIDVSGDGWDSEAIAYPYVLDVGEKMYMFYNGNGFGRTGFGYAEYKK